MKHLIVLAMALPLLFGSCMKSINTTSSNAQQYSYISVLNLAYYSPAAQLYFNDSLASSSALNPLQYSSSYGHFYPGYYDVKFKTASGTILGEIPTSPYDSATFYTLILYNTGVNGPAVASKIQDDFSTVTQSASYYRFFNFSPSTGAVDLYFAGSKVQTSRTPADNIGQSGLNAFSPYASGYYTLMVKKAGTDTTLATATQIGLQAGVAYTIFVDGPKDSLAINVLTAQY